MGVGAGLYMCDVVKKFTFAISSPDEFLFSMGWLGLVGFGFSIRVRFRVWVRF